MNAVMGIAIASKITNLYDQHLRAPVDGNGDIDFFLRIGGLGLPPVVFFG